MEFVLGFSFGVAFSAFLGLNAKDLVAKAKDLTEQAKGKK